MVLRQLVTTIAGSGSTHTLGTVEISGNTFVLQIQQD